MNKEEYRYILHDLAGTIWLYDANDSVETRYYMKGIINTYRGILKKFGCGNYREDIKKVLKRGHII